MIWTKELQAAALAVTKETRPPWYAAHIEQRLKERAFDMSGWAVGAEITTIKVAEIEALRRQLDPYNARPSHQAFGKAWRAAAEPVG